jgi:hypothetical protein
MERLTERHQPVRPWCDCGQVLGQTLDPADVHDCLLRGHAGPLRQHGGIRVQADHLLEQMSKADGQHARAAADIQQCPFPVRPVSRVRTASSCGEYAGQPW